MQEGWLWFSIKRAAIENEVDDLAAVMKEIHCKEHNYSDPHAVLTVGEDDSQWPAFLQRHTSTNDNRGYPHQRIQL